LPSFTRKLARRTNVFTWDISQLYPSTLMGYNYNLYALPELIPCQLATMVCIYQKIKCNIINYMKKSLTTSECTQNSPLENAQALSVQNMGLHT